MCIICDDFRIKRCGIVELDSTRLDFGILGGLDVSVSVTKHYSEAYLTIVLDDKSASSVPISFCPLCGQRIGGKKCENMESHLD